MWIVKYDNLRNSKWAISKKKKKKKKNLFVTGQKIKNLCNILIVVSSTA